MTLALATFDQALPETAPEGAPAWVHLLPVGAIAGRDGRRLTLADPEALIAAFAEGRIDLPVDYEHQNDRAAPERTGPVPAAGWIKELAVRAGGLWGRVEWTARARELIAAREHRYLSPVVLHRRDGTVARLKGASLVHNPNLYLTALAAQEDPMTDELDFKARLAEALGLGADAEADAILGEVMALLAARKTLDPRRFVPVETMAELLRDRSERLALHAEQAKVDDAMKRGCLTGGMKAWALALCREDPASFEAFLASAAPAYGHLLRRDARPGFDRGERRDRAGSDEEASLCRQLGLAPGALAS